MDLSDMRNAKLVNVDFHAELDDRLPVPQDEAREDRYYLSLTYYAENDAGTWEINFPKVMLPFCTRWLPGTITNYPGNAKIDFGFAILPLDANDDGHYASAKLIEERVYDMTIEEIERRLGRKIRIVGEETK